MGIVEIEENGRKYSAEYFLIENLITVHGQRGAAEIALNGMSEQLAARTALRALVRKGEIDPTDSNEA
jgi:hypothetical protein